MAVSIEIIHLIANDALVFGNDQTIRNGLGHANRVVDLAVGRVPLLDVPALALQTPLKRLKSVVEAEFN